MRRLTSIARRQEDQNGEQIADHSQTGQQQRTVDGDVLFHEDERRRRRHRCRCLEGGKTPPRRRHRRKDSDKLLISSLSLSLSAWERKRERERKAKAFPPLTKEICQRILLAVGEERKSRANSSA